MEWFQRLVAVGSWYVRILINVKLRDYAGSKP